MNTNYIYRIGIVLLIVVAIVFVPYGLGRLIDYLFYPFSDTNTAIKYWALGTVSTMVVFALASVIARIIVGTFNYIKNGKFDL